MAINVYDTLGRELLLARYEHEMSPGSHVDAPARDAWETAILHIDAAQEPCRVLYAEPNWIGFVERPFGWVYVESWGLAAGSLRIARLTDPAEYYAD